MNGAFAHTYQERDRQAFVGASSRWNVYKLKTPGTGKSRSSTVLKVRSHQKANKHYYLSIPSF